MAIWASEVRKLMDERTTAMRLGLTRGSAAALISFAVCVFGSGCASKENMTVWKAAFPSPDGSYIATADTVQNGGFGSASIETNVYLEQAGHSDQPTEVLGFSCDGPMSRPYVLDNVANAGGGINLSVKWITPSHLHVTYQGRADVSFQAVKFGKLVITLKNLADKSVNNDNPSEAADH
jgi:hypothetical protein